MLDGIAGGQSVEVLPPRLQVEGFLGEVHQAKADNAVVTCHDLPASSGGGERSGYNPHILTVRAASSPELGACTPFHRYFNCVLPIDIRRRSIV